MMTKLIDENKVMTKLSHTEPLDGGDNTKERYRYMQWMADVNAIKELKPEKAIVIPEGATNGDMMKTMFPNINFCDMAYTVHATTNVTSNGVKGGISYDFWKEWWNAPYRVEREELSYDIRRTI